MIMIGSPLGQSADSSVGSASIVTRARMVAVGDIELGVGLLPEDRDQDVLGQGHRGRGVRDPAHPGLGSPVGLLAREAPLLQLALDLGGEPRQEREPARNPDLGAAVLRAGHLDHLEGIAVRRDGDEVEGLERLDLPLEKGLRMGRVGHRDSSWPWGAPERSVASRSRIRVSASLRAAATASGFFAEAISLSS